MKPFITVVSGLPRSGTSLMMQMLAAGGMPVLTDSVRAADEDNPRGYLEFEPVKGLARDAGWVAEAEGKAVKVICVLLRELPADYQYRVILMQRDLREVVASQRAMLERSGREGAAVGDQRLLEIFGNEMRDLNTWLASQGNFEVLEVSYLECLRKPGRAARKVAAFLGAGLYSVALDAEAMAAAVDISLYRQTR